MSAASADPYPKSRKSTESLAMYIHKTTLDFLDFGYGSALAALMFLLSMAATSGYLRYTRRSAGREP